MQHLPVHGTNSYSVEGSVPKKRIAGEKYKVETPTAGAETSKSQLVTKCNLCYHLLLATESHKFLFHTKRSQKWGRGHLFSRWNPPPHIPAPSHLQQLCLILYCHFRRMASKMEADLGIWVWSLHTRRLSLLHWESLETPGRKKHSSQQHTTTRLDAALHRLEKWKTK